MSSRHTFVTLLICGLMVSTGPACVVRTWFPAPRPKPTLNTEAPNVHAVDPKNVRAGLDQLEFNELERANLERLSQLAEVFYDHLSHRRINSIATYHDPALREFFRDDEAFADYYADLVQALSDAHFERNRPSSVVVKGIAVEDGAQRVSLLVRFGGENNLPLRFWSTSYLRLDTWDYWDGRWWVVPGKL